jgi:hypothetical protein
MDKFTSHNTGLAKVAVQCSADTFEVNQSWFSASTFVVKIATFAKPETAVCDLNNQRNSDWCFKTNLSGLPKTAVKICL